MLYLITVLLCLLPFTFCSCPNGSYEWHSTCYKFVTNATSFLDAEAHCISMGGHLASIHDGFTNSFLTQQASQNLHNQYNDFWIGLSNTQTIGGLSWSDGTVLDYLEWGPNQPGPLTVNNCAAVNIRNGLWKIESFSQQKPYFCIVGSTFNTVTSPPPTTSTTPLRSTRTYSTTPTQQKCTGNFTYFYPTNSCYGVFYTEEDKGKNWIFGENLCNNFGGHLASVHSDEEIDFIMHLGSIANSNYFPWTGLFTNGNGAWEWSDGTSVDYLPGNPIPGPNLCAYINEMNLLEAYDCTEDATVLCKK